MLPEAAVKDTELKLARSGLEHVASPLPEVAAPENERKVFINLLHRRYIRFFQTLLNPTTSCKLVQFTGNRFTFLIFCMCSFVILLGTTTLYGFHVLTCNRSTACHGKMRGLFF